MSSRSPINISKDEQGFPPYQPAAYTGETAGKVGEWRFESFRLSAIAWMTVIGDLSPEFPTCSRFLIKVLRVILVGRTGSPCIRTAGRETPPSHAIRACQLYVGWVRPDSFQKRQEVASGWETTDYRRSIPHATVWERFEKCTRPDGEHQQTEGWREQRGANSLSAPVACLPIGTNGLKIS